MRNRHKRMLALDILFLCFLVYYKLSNKNAKGRLMRFLHRIKDSLQSDNVIESKLIQGEPNDYFMFCFLVFLPEGKAVAPFKFYRQ